MLRPEHVHPNAGGRRRRMPDVNATPAGKRLPHPAAHAPRIFADTAELEAIRALREGGIINGVTTNPTLLKRAGADSETEALRIQQTIVDYLAPDPVSLELTELEPEAMFEQARALAVLGENVVVKVPVGGYGQLDRDPFTGLKLLRRLWEADVRTNATLVFNSTQAFWAANAGASYVSPFLGRLADYLYAHDHVERTPGNALFHLENHRMPEGGDDVVANSEYVATGGARRDAGVRLIHEIVALFANYAIETEVLAASFRNAAQVSDCLLAGVDILTVPAELLRGVADHPLTDAGMHAFLEDAKAFA